MAAINPSALLRLASTNRISQMIKRQDAASPSIYGTIPDVGQFNTPGSLPTDPGEIDPPILTGDYPAPNIGPTPGVPSHNDIWTHMDPGMGYINPSLTIDPSAGGPTNYGGGISFDPTGVLQGGTRGPQGTVYGTDPNTGQPIYNVTGSPKPGFLDSPAGKILTTGASAGLNMFVPGLGFVSKAIFDAIRRNQTARNTGTDLTHTNQHLAAPPASGAVQGPPSIPGGGALFGYKPSQGGGTPRFDFTRGSYSSTPSLNPLYTTGGPWAPVSGAPTDIRFAQNSGTGNFTADQTVKAFDLAGGYKGTPNRAVAPDAGRNRFSTGTGFMGGIDEDTGLLQRIATLTVTPFSNSQGGAPLQGVTADPYNASVMQSPAYQAYMQRIAQSTRLPGAPPMSIMPAFQTTLQPRAGQGGG